MEYTISKKKRIGLIFCSLFLILKSLIMGFIFIYIEPVNFNLTMNGVLKILDILAYSFLILVLVDYFRNYKLKALQIITLFVLAVEIMNRFILLINLFTPSVPKIILSILGVIWTIVTIGWIILLFRTKAMDFPALISIRKYAVAIIVSIFLSVITPILIIPITNSHRYFELTLGLIFSVPYIFIIEFGLKLPLKE